MIGSRANISIIIFDKGVFGAQRKSISIQIFGGGSNDGRGTRIPPIHKPAVCKGGSRAQRKKRSVCGPSAVAPNAVRTGMRDIQDPEIQASCQREDPRGSQQTLPLIVQMILHQCKLLRIMAAFTIIRLKSSHRIHSVPQIFPTERNTAIGSCL